jgi:hypothetical protein
MHGRINARFRLAILPAANLYCVLNSCHDRIGCLGCWLSRHDSSFGILLLLNLWGNTIGPYEGVCWPFCFCTYVSCSWQWGGWKSSDT